MSKYGVFSGPYFPAFELNAERYFVSLRIQPKRGKIRTRENSVFGHFSRSTHQLNLTVVHHLNFFSENFNNFNSLNLNQIQIIEIHNALLTMLKLFPQIYTEKSYHVSKNSNKNCLH